MKNQTSCPSPGPRVAGILLSLLAGTLLPLPAMAEGDAPDLRVLFPRQAEIRWEGASEDGGPGPVRLELPPEVLRHVRPDLSDLRIVTSDGEEVPYLVDAGREPERQIEVRREERAEVLEVRRTVVEALDAPEGAPGLHREVFEIAVPTVELRVGTWDLVFESRRPSFVRQVTVEGRTADGEVLALVPEGSLFRLPNPRREKTNLTLPGLPPSVTRLVVTIEGEEGSFLDPALRFEARRHISHWERVAVELRMVRFPEQENGKTVVEVERPRGLVPDLLRFGTVTHTYRRQVEIWDEGPGSRDDALGQGVIYQVKAEADVKSIDVPLDPARGDRLRILIDDGDSPPLDLLVIQAVVRRPALIFVPPSETGLTLLIGGGRAFRPRYDLEHLRLPESGELQGDPARLAERLYDPRFVTSAALGPLEENPAYDATPVLAFAWRPGADLDVGEFRWRRQLKAEPSEEGLVRFRLDVEDLHRAQPGLVDLRIADEDGRQWAYLLEQTGPAKVRSLPIERTETEGGTSTYSFTLPADSVELDRLTLTLPAPYFDRTYQLRGTHGERELTLARGRLQRRVGDPRPVVLSFPRTWLETLELAIDDGSDAPLEITEAEARVLVADLYFAAPEGRYTLLLGNPEAEVPRYELASLRSVVLATASGPAWIEPLEENPAHSAWNRLTSAAGAQKLFLWLALIAAVLLLGWMTLRLARDEDSSSA